MWRRLSGLGRLVGSFTILMNCLCGCLRMLCCVRMPRVRRLPARAAAEPLPQEGSTSAEGLTRPGRSSGWWRCATVRLPPELEIRLHQLIQNTRAVMLIWGFGEIQDGRSLRLRDEMNAGCRRVPPTLHACCALPASPSDC